MKKEMPNGKILHLSNKLSLNSDWYLTETSNKKGPDLVPSSDNYESKGNENSEYTQRGSLGTRAILATAFRDFDSPEGERMVPEIQQSIMAHQSLMGFEAFANAKNYAEARKAVEAWKVQYSYDDITGDSYLPSETFSNFALELVSLYEGKTQKYIQTVFNKIYDLVQGKKQASFKDLMDGVEVDNTPRSLGEAIKKVLDLEYKPVKERENGKDGSTAVGSDVENGEEGRSGGTGKPGDGEPAKEGEGPADNRGGAGEDSRLHDGANNLPEKEKQLTYKLSDKVDENGRQFVLTNNGDLKFGKIKAETGLPEAPI